MRRRASPQQQPTRAGRARPAAVGLLLGLLGSGFGARAVAQDAASSIAYQRGLYLQLTRGQLDGALEAYRQAERLAGDAVPDAVALRRVECLQWAGQHRALEQLLAELARRPDPAAERLGPAAVLPPGCDLVGRLDVAALRRAPGLAGLVEGIRPDGTQAAGGLAELLDRGALGWVERLSFGASLADDAVRPVGRWLVLVETQAAPPVEPAGWFRSLLSRLAAEPDGADALLQRALLGAPAVAAEPLPAAAAAGERVHGRRLWRVELPAAAPLQQLAVARLDAGQILIGQPAALHQSLAAAAGRAIGLRGSPRLWRLVRRVPDDVHFWLVIAPQQFLEQLGQVQRLLGWGRELPAIDGVAVYGRLQGDLQLDAVVRAADSQTLGQVADLARGGSALLRLSAVAATDGGDPAVQTVIDALRVEVDERNAELKLSLRIPAALLNRLQIHQGRQRSN
jgi:hypothetical protein